MRPAELPAGNYWWYLRFRMEWLEGNPPAWHTDLLLADLVVRPVLELRRADITLWRVHRRAARDAAGHQFSFIFYATPETARDVFAEIEASPALGMARAGGRVTAVLQDDPLHPSRPERADTSDPAWSAALRTAWPDYLMGASRMWLSLVSQLAAPPAPGRCELQGARRRVRTRRCGGDGGVARGGPTRLPAPPQRALRVRAAPDALLTRTPR